MKKLGSFLKLAWQVSPGYIVLLVLQSLTSAAKLLINVILPKYLVDELMGSREPKFLLLFGGLIVLNNVGMFWLEKLYKRLLESKQVYVRQTMNRRMAEKIMKLEYSYLEDPYYLDLKERAVFVISNQDAISQLILCVSSVLSGAFTLAGLLVVIATLGPVMILVLLVGVVLSLLCYKIMSDSMVKVMTDIIPINRKMGYYLSLQSEKQFQKDIRLYEMQDLITDHTREFSVAVCDDFEKFYRQEGRSMGGINIINDAIAAICYAYVGLRTVSSRFGSQISIGSLTMYVAAAINFTTSILQFGTQVVTMLQELAFMDPFMEFMVLEEETKDVV